MKKIIFLLICILMTSCSIFYPTWNTSAQEIIENAEVKEDNFSGTKWIIFQDVKPYVLQDRNDVLGTWSTLLGRYYIRASVDTKTNYPKFLQICVITDNRYSWGFYYKAIDKKGKELDFTEIDKKVGTATNSSKPVEYFALTFDMQYLKENKDDNLIIKVYGKRDEFVFYVPQSYLEGVFKYFERNESQN